MIDRTELPEATPAASRRVFHSKVDTIRPTYGFEDVSLAPGTDTVEPADVDLTQTFCGIPLEIPILASAMDAVVDVRLAGELAPPRRSRGPQSRGRPDPLRRPRRRPGADRHRTRRRRPGAPRRGLPAADPRGPDRGPARGDPRRAAPRPPSPPRPPRPAGSGRSAPSTAPTCSSSRARCPPPGTSPPTTTRSRSPSSPATCRSPSRSATRRTPRQPSR